MRVSQMLWHHKKKSWDALAGQSPLNTPQLILYFGALPLLKDAQPIQELRSLYPHAILMGCSSGGTIVHDQLLDDIVIANLITFDNTPLKHVFSTLAHADDSFITGEKIAQTLYSPDLKSLFILSDGVIVNGVELVKGLRHVIGDHIPITGGFAGDRVDLFTVSLVGLNEHLPQSGGIAALGLYGNAIRIGHGSVGGWDPFGPERIVTRSKGRVVYTLDQKPVLKLYQSYLEDKAAGLPGTGLLFPLAIRTSKDQKDWTVRTMIAVDEKAQSITFAGDVPEGSICQLMHGNFDRLVEGAVKAAQDAAPASGALPQFSILVSCIGRRVLMGQRVVDEIEHIQSLWKGAIPTAGFYSYGEISPLSQSGVCAFHNQTMTITTWGES